MMKHNDDAFATMLLMSQISAEKEELVHPLSTGEYYRLREQLRGSSIRRVGLLIDRDIATVQQALGIQEEAAYRICVLMSRAMQLSYAIERFAEKGIEICTVDEKAYPKQLAEKLGDKAPPMFYCCGEERLASALSVALIGSSPAAGAVKEAAKVLIRAAIDASLTLVTGGKVGFDRFVEEQVMLCGGSFVSCLAESLAEKSLRPGVSEMIASRRALLISSFHPDARYTLTHALEANKCVYALSNAAIVLSCEKGRGGAWEGACSALRNRFTERLYVWENHDLPGNMELIARGATAFTDPARLPIKQLAAQWAAPTYEQTCFI